MQLDALTPGAVAPHPVGIGEFVHDGDGIALSVWPEQSAHLYVLRYAPSGQSELYFPLTSEKAVGGKQRIRIPEGTQRLTVGGAPGEELLYVIASPEPILKLIPDFCDRFRLSCQPGTALSAGRGDPDPPPVGTPPEGRPTEESKEHVITATADQRGIVMVRLPFRHGP